MIEIKAVGGFSEVGRNMCAVKYKNEVIILDMGIHLENFIRLKGDEDSDLIDKEELVQADAVPNDSSIEDWKKKVIAIVPSHAHLDHIGAIPYMASAYNAPIICTPYTAEVIKAILRDKEIKIFNHIHVLNYGKQRLSKNIELEFVNITHSIPHTAIVIIHTPDGAVVYANDFKLDDTPVIGEKPDYLRLEEVGEQGVKCLLIDSLYADQDKSTPSESVARQMLKDTLLKTNCKGKTVIVTTFSSHIARLKSINEFGKIMKRKVVFLGRSLNRYATAAQNLNLEKFQGVDIVPYKSKIKRKLRDIEKDGRDKYLIVVTGHQGEPRSVLSEIASGKLRFKLFPKDIIIFSCNVIPTQLNVDNREKLESKLKKLDVTFYKDIHVSGHASRKDHAKLMKLLSPDLVIPAHVGPDRARLLAEFAKKIGYESQVIEDGKLVKIF